MTYRVWIGGMKLLLWITEVDKLNLELAKLQRQLMMKNPSRSFWRRLFTRVPQKLVVLRDVCGTLWRVQLSATTLVSVSRFSEDELV